MVLFDQTKLFYLHYSTIIYLFFTFILSSVIRNGTLNLKKLSAPFWA